MATKPAVLIVPGSFCSTVPYQPLATQLRSLGYDTYLIPLQSVGRRPSPPPNMNDDAAFIADQVRKLIDQGLEIVIMAHSYSGVPVSQCTKGLTLKERGAQGLQGGISHLIYCTAIVPAVGGCLAGDDPSVMPESIRNSGPYMSTDIALAMAPATFPEYSEEQAREAAGMMQEQAKSTYFDKLSWAGYKDVPCTYILQTEDKLVTPEQQLGHVEVLKKHAPKLNVVENAAGHAPMVTRLDQFVEVMKGILEQV